MKQETLLPFLIALGMVALLVLGYMPIQSPVLGLVVSDVKGPIAITPSTPGPRVGQAAATTILGLVARGDASIEAAARKGGIRTIMTVNYSSYNILGVYARFTTTVTGE